MKVKKKMINKGYVYAETLEVLQNMDKNYVMQIPQKFIDALKKEASKEYKNHLNR